MPDSCPKHSEHEVRIKRNEDDILDLDSRSTNIATHVSEIDNTLIKHDEWIKRSNERIEKTEKLTEAIVEVTTEIRISNKNQEKILKAITTSQAEHDARLKVVEQMPAKDALERQKLVATVIITSVTSGAVGFVLSNFAR